MLTFSAFRNPFATSCGFYIIISVISDKCYDANQPIWNQPFITVSLYGGWYVSRISLISLMEFCKKTLYSIFPPFPLNVTIGAIAEKQLHRPSTSPLISTPFFQRYVLELNDTLQQTIYCQHQSLGEGILWAWNKIFNICESSNVNKKEKHFNLNLFTCTHGKYIFK